MMGNSTGSKIDSVGISNLYSEYLSLRIGEAIPRLEIKEIKKVTNPEHKDNLSGVDYLYLIISSEDKVLTVNSWALWRKIAEIARTAETTKVTIQLKHPGVGEYEVGIVKSGEGVAL